MDGSYREARGDREGKNRATRSKVKTSGELNLRCSSKFLEPQKARTYSKEIVGSNRLTLNRSRSYRNHSKAMAYFPTSSTLLKYNLLIFKARNYLSIITFLPKYITLVIS